jgi:hypothetical protein
MSYGPNLRVVGLDEFAIRFDASLDLCAQASI